MHSKIRNSHNLEVISENPVSQEVDPRERRRRPRLSLSSEQFRLNMNGKIFSVADLSLEGMALRVLEREDFQLFPVATQLSGSLNLRGQKYPVQAKVVRLGSEIVGCEFHSVSQEVKDALARLLDPAELGKELKPIPAGDMGTIWYHGPMGTDLLLWRGVDGQFHRVLLYVGGSFVQWDAEEGLNTGAVTSSDAQSEMRGVVRFETALMQRDERPASDKLSIAKEVLVSSNLSQDLKKWCLRRLEIEKVS